MGKQPEGKVSAKIIAMINKRGGYAWKVHGNEYQPAGTPDICGTYKGWSVWWETKMPGNKPSMAQWRIMRNLRRAGALTCVPYSVAEAVQMLDHIDTGEHTLNDCGCLYSTPIDLRQKLRDGEYK